MNVCENRTDISNIPVQTNWIPPESPFYSICCDAAFKKTDLNHSGIGLILRNFAGQFEQAQCTYAYRHLNAEQVECEGLLKAIEWAKELHLQHGCLELDVQAVVEAVTQDLEKVAWENQSIVLQIRSKLWHHPTWRCKFIRRKNNKPADSLAKHSRIFKVSRSWMGLPPNFIANVIQAEENSVLLFH